MQRRLTVKTVCLTWVRSIPSAWRCGCRAGGLWRAGLLAGGYEGAAAGDGEDVVLLFQALDGLLDGGHGQAGLLDELLDAGDLVAGLEFPGIDGGLDLVG